MKKALFVILAFIVVFVACKKKVPDTKCYICTRYGLIYAPIYIQYNKPREQLATDTVCNLNEGTYQIYVNSHTHLDTIYHGTHNDTIILEQFSSICEPM